MSSPKYQVYRLGNAVRKPCFVLMASDVFAVPALTAYRDAIGGRVDSDELAEIDARIDEILAWQRAHPDLVHLPSRPGAEGMAY